MVNPNPGEVVFVFVAAKPNIIVFAFVVETPVTVGIDADVEIANLGIEAFASHGDAVLAPLTPKTMQLTNEVDREKFMVIDADDNDDAAIAYQCSIFSLTDPTEVLPLPARFDHDNPPPLIEDTVAALKPLASDIHSTTITSLLLDVVILILKLPAEAVLELNPSTASTAHACEHHSRNARAAAKRLNMLRFPP